MLNSMFGAMRGVAPGPLTGAVPYAGRIGGAIPGQEASLLGTNLLGLGKKRKKAMAGQVPTAANGTETPESPAAVGQQAGAKRRAFFPTMGY